VNAGPAIHNAVEQGSTVMADSQHSERPVVVSRAKRDSYLHHVRIHMELLQDSLAGDNFGCGVGQGDRDEIDKHLLEIWNIASAVKLVVVDDRPAPAAPSADNVTAAPGAPGGKVIPFRPRLAG
jgi:hypothetical protein